MNKQTARPGREADQADVHSRIGAALGSNAGRRTADVATVRIPGLLLDDRFENGCSRGKVLGSTSSNGQVRNGIDVERVLSIDNGALRIQPLIRAGWGRCVLQYGPYEAVPGLTLAVFMTHGHATSQAERLPETFRKRLDRWLRGPETEGRFERIIRWLRAGRFRRTFRQFHWWYALSRRPESVPTIDENLAIGWSSVPAGTVLNQGAGIVMHATGAENGELWVGANGHLAPTVRGVQNVPVYYVVILRTGGTVMYSSSLPGAFGHGEYPCMRPVGFAHAPLEGSVHAVIDQSVLGQIGFRHDTRIHGIRAAVLSGWDRWWAGAHAADSLTGSGLLGGSLAETRGTWRHREASPIRTDRGATGSARASASLQTGRQAGLLGAQVEPDAAGNLHIALLWRWLDDQNHWRVEFENSVARLICIERGNADVIAEVPLSDRNAFDVLILDDGTAVTVFRDQATLIGRVSDRRFEDGTAVAIEISTGYVRRFEVHPRSLGIPAPIDMGAPALELGNRVVLADDFTGELGDLHGRQLERNVAWARSVGTGTIEVISPGKAKVRASKSAPSRGRTVYTAQWPDPEFADVEVTITPPGTQRGEGEMGRSGVVIWQDPENYVLVNIWLHDTYGGASISTFFRINGFEDLYDAVWANVGARVRWGHPLRLRVTCDGRRYGALVDDEPVIVRAFTDVYPDCDRLLINRVGIATNWEWGEDTGSTLSGFRARGRDATHAASSLACG